MSRTRAAATQIYQLFHRRLLWWLIAVYALGAIWPELGRWVRGVPISGEGGGWLLKVMLGMLLLNAGLGLETRHLVRLVRRWRVLCVAVLLSFAVPGALVLMLSWAIGIWGMSDPAQATLIGLAVIAAMPTAGSSTAWSQNAEGDMALTLGLVLGTTLVGPLTVVVLPPLVMQLLQVSPGGSSSAVISHAAAVFLTLWVLIPAMVGVGLRHVFGTARVERIKPYMKLVNLANLLLLNYANASLSLPEMIARPQPVYLTSVLLATVSVALVVFPGAALLARVGRVNAAQRASLMFGLGMKNNGAGLVLVSTAFPAPGPILLPIILYNIVQHLAAGVIDRFVLAGRGRHAGRDQAALDAASGAEVQRSTLPPPEVRSA